MIAGPVSGNAGFIGWIILPCLLFAITLAIGYNGLYGQDSFEYLRYSRAIHAFFTDGKSPGQFFWPVMYPLSGAILSFVLPDILSLQLASIVCYGFTYYFLRKILSHVFPDKLKEVTICLLLFFSLSPFIVRYSVSVMSEPMALLFIAAFFYYYLLFSENRGNRYFPVLVFFACAAVNSRYPSIVILLVPFIHASFLFIKNFRLSTFMISLLILFIGLCPFFLLNIYKADSYSGRPDLMQWSFVNYFKRSFITPDGNQSYLLPNILYVFKVLVHPGYIFPGLLFLIFLKRTQFQRTFLKTVFLSVLLYAFFLAGLQFQNDRVLLLSFPLILILYSGSFLKVSEKSLLLLLSFRRGGRGVRCIIISIIIIQLFLFYVAFRPFYRDNVNTHIIVLNMYKYPGKKIYTFNIDMALKGYGLKNETISLWSNNIKIFEPNALVLFNFTDSKKQWKGMNPMLSWDRLNRDHHLKLLENFPEGWNLYEITD